MIDIYLDQQDAALDARDHADWSATEEYYVDERYELLRDAEFTRLEELADQRDAMLDARGVYDDREF